MMPVPGLPILGDLADRIGLAGSRGSANTGSRAPLSRHRAHTTHPLRARRSVYSWLQSPLMALAVPAVEDLTSRSRRELPRVRLLGQLQAQHTVAPGNPDFARRLGVAEFVMAPTTCSCDELHHPFRFGLS